MDTRDISVNRRQIADETGEREMFKIEALVKNQWTDDAVGNPNEFEAEAEAIAAIPELARIFECPETDFRVVAHS